MLAAGSIAVVHLGYLENRTVVVKMKRINIEESIKVYGIQI